MANSNGERVDISRGSDILKSLAWGRQEGKEAQGIIFVQLGFLHIWSRVSVLFSGIGTRIQHWNPHIGTAKRVSVPL
ncbi:hypothetical protein GQ457_HM001620 [Hibiscus cannabinus]